MQNNVATTAAPSAALALSEETLNALVLGGDLSKLSPPQKIEYYRSFCTRIGLDPATHPFKLLTFQGKQVLYCDRGGTAQLNKLHHVSHRIVSRSSEGGIYLVQANASTPDGHQTESIGAVSIAGLGGENLANAMMKAETKAKRRSTLDLLGLGMLDESELESMPDVQSATVVGSEPLAASTAKGGKAAASKSLPPASAPAAAQATTAAPSAEPEPQDPAGRLKFIRGKLNQALLKVVDSPKEFAAIRGELNKTHGKEFEKELTGVRPNETFESLLTEHWKRIGHAANQRKFQSDVGSTFDVPQFRKLEQAFFDGHVDQSKENEAAINAKGAALKLPEYTAGATSPSADAAAAGEEDPNAAMEG